MRWDGNAATGYQAVVLYVPATSGLASNGCPSSYADAATAVAETFGGPTAVYAHHALGVGTPLLGGGPYQYTASVNDGIVPTVTDAGQYTACAYLKDLLGDTTYAYTPAPVTFPVGLPPGAGTPPSASGGPGGKPTSAQLGLVMTPGHPPVRSPGRNLLEISGHSVPENGPVYLAVTVKDARQYDGCAPNEEEDEQITRADNGAILALAEAVTINSAGTFRTPLAANFQKALHTTAVFCPYLVQVPGSDIARGYLRATLPATKARKHHRHKKRRGSHRAKKHHG